MVHLSASKFRTIPEYIRQWEHRGYRINEDAQHIFSSPIALIFLQVKILFNVLLLRARGSKEMAIRFTARRILYLLFRTRTPPTQSFSFIELWIMDRVGRYGSKEL